MARLTWQEVSNPNFSGAADSYRVMSELLGKATTSGMGMVNTFTNEQKDAADRAIQLRALALQSPQDFVTGLKDGSVVGADGANASMAALTGLDTRVGTVLNHATTGQTLAKNTYDDNRLVDGNAILDANAEKINTARSAAAMGQHDQALTILAGIPNLRTDQYEGILTDAGKFADNHQSRDVVGQRLKEDRWGFGNTQTAFNDNKAGVDAAAQIISKYATPEEARPELLKEFQAGHLTSQAFVAATGQLNTMGYGNVVAPYGTGGAGGASGGGGASGDTGGAPSAMGDGNSRADRNNNPGNIKAVGWVKSMPGYKGIDSNGGPDSGYAQFETPEQGMAAMQEQLRRYTVGTEATGGKKVNTVAGIVGTWSPPGAAGNSNAATQNYTNFVAKQLGIAPDAVVTEAMLPKMASAMYQFESGKRGNISPTDANLQTSIVDRSLKEDTSQNNSVNAFPDYDKLLQDSRPTYEIANGLIGEGGAYPGANATDVSRAIDILVEKSQSTPRPITPALGGEILRRNRVQKNPYHFWESSMPGGVRFNESNVMAALDDYTSGRAGLRANLNEQNDKRATQIKTAETGYTNAYAAYTDAVARSADDPRLVGRLPAFKAALDRAEVLRKDALGTANKGRTPKASEEVNAAVQRAATKTLPDGRLIVDPLVAQSTPFWLWQSQPSPGYTPPVGVKTRR